MGVSVLTFSDEYWMQQALQLAHIAAAKGEVPVAAVLVKNNEFITQAYNQSIITHDPCAHAEILALRQAGAQLNNYRLLHTTLYVTLEPCCMCASAMVHARIQRLVYAADDPKTGAAGSVFNLVNNTAFNHSIAVTRGVLLAPCSTLLQQFFQARRKRSLHPAALNT